MKSLASLAFGVAVTTLGAFGTAAPAAAHDNGFVGLRIGPLGIGIDVDGHRHCRYHRCGYRHRYHRPYYDDRYYGGYYGGYPYDSGYDYYDRPYRPHYRRHYRYRDDWRWRDGDRRRRYRGHW